MARTFFITLELTNHLLLQNDVDEKSGTILFGGIDSKKYGGDIATLPLKPMPALSSSSSDATTNITSYAIGISGIKVSGASIPSTTNNAVAVLDSGSTTCLFPSSIAKAIQKEFSVYTEPGVPFGLVDCAYSGDKGKAKMFSFEFDGKTIKVPAKEMVVDAFPEDTQRQLRQADTQGVFKGWKSACLFGVGSSGELGVSSDQFFLLGDTFLRSAYVVYDMGNKNIGLAQANIHSNDSSVTEVKSGSKTIPKIPGVNGE